MIRFHLENMEKNIWTDEKIPIRESEHPYLYELVEDTTEEEMWFKNNAEKLYKSHGVYIGLMYNEEDIRKHYFAIYANNCYKKGQGLPVQFNLFNKWLNEYVLNRIFIKDGGTVLYTFREMYYERAVLRYTYYELEAFENLVDPNRRLNEQETLVDGITQCFDLRWKIEEAKKNVVIGSLGIAAVELIVNEFYIKNEPNQTLVLLDGAIYSFDHDEEMAEFIKKEMELNEQANPEEGLQDKDPILNDIQAELEFVFESIQEYDEYCASKPERTYKGPREFARLYWKIRKHFLGKGEGYEPFLIRVEEDQIYLSNAKEFYLRFKGETVYRDTMEEIYNLDILLYEIEKEKEKFSEERKKREEKAKRHFYQFLSSENIKRFEENKYVLIETEHNKYALHKRKAYNNILKRDKETGVTKTICLTPVNPQISEYDVFTTIIMMLQSGKESHLLETGNEYPLLDDDKEIVHLVFGKKKTA